MQVVDRLFNASKTNVLAFLVCIGKKPTNETQTLAGTIVGKMYNALAEKSSMTITPLKQGVSVAYGGDLVDIVGTIQAVYINTLSKLSKLPMMPVQLDEKKLANPNAEVLRLLINPPGEPESLQKHLDACTQFIRELNKAWCEEADDVKIDIKEFLTEEEQNEFSRNAE